MDLPLLLGCNCVRLNQSSQQLSWIWVLLPMVDQRLQILRVLECCCLVLRDAVLPKFSSGLLLQLIFQLSLHACTTEMVQYHTLALPLSEDCCCLALCGLLLLGLEAGYSSLFWLSLSLREAMYTWVLGIFSALLVLLPVAVECCLYLQLTLAEAFCPSYSSRNSQKNNEIYQTQYPTWYWYRILGPKQSCAHNTVFLPPFSQPHTVLYGALWDLLPFLQLLKPFVSLA